MYEDRLEIEISKSLSTNFTYPAQNQANICLLCLIYLIVLMFCLVFLLSLLNQLGEKYVCKTKSMSWDLETSTNLIPIMKQRPNCVNGDDEE